MRKRRSRTYKGHVSYGRRPKPKVIVKIVTAKKYSKKRRSSKSSSGVIDKAASMINNLPVIKNLI